MTKENAPIKPQKRKMKKKIRQYVPRRLKIKAKGRRVGEHITPLSQTHEPFDPPPLSKLCIVSKLKWC